MLRWRYSPPACWVSLLAAGCATPIGVKRISPQEANRALTANVLTTGEPGAPAQEFLYRLNLSEKYREDPAGTIAELHAGLGQADESNRLFALAELSFDYAEHGGGRSYYLASAAYAWAFLFPDDPASRPGCYDPRVRTAMDLYNRGVAQGLASGTGDEVDLSARSVALPYGPLQTGRGSVRFHVRRLPARPLHVAGGFPGARTAQPLPPPWHRRAARRLGVEGRGTRGSVDRAVRQGARHRAAPLRRSAPRHERRGAARHHPAVRRR